MGLLSGGTEASRKPRGTQTLAEDFQQLLVSLQAKGCRREEPLAGSNRSAPLLVATGRWLIWQASLRLHFTVACSSALAGPSCCSAALLLLLRQQARRSCISFCTISREGCWGVEAYDPGCICRPVQLLLPPRPSKLGLPPPRPQGAGAYDLGEALLSIATTFSWSLSAGRAFTLLPSGVAQKVRPSMAVGGPQQIRSLCLPAAGKI